MAVLGHALSARRVGVNGLAGLIVVALANFGGVSCGSASTETTPNPNAPLLAFMAQPSAALAGTPLSPVQVAVKDASGNTLTTATTGITLSIANGTGASGAVLGGTLARAAVNGVAVFNDLTVDKAGTGYVIVASGAGLTSVSSASFDVTTSAIGCANPQAGWIWCDDFDVDRFASYFEVVTDNNRMARVAGVGRGSSYGLRAHFGVGDVSAGSLKLAFGKTPDPYMKPVDAGTKNYREIYWRVFVKNAANWTGGGGDKLTRLTVFAAPSWAQAMIAHVWSGTGANANYLVIDPASGTDVNGVLKTTAYNDFPNLRFLGLVRSQTPIFDAAHVGQWYCIESHVRLNTAGQSDGLFELRINTQLEASKTNMNWLGSYSAYGLNAILLESFWNAGSPASQDRYFDDFVVSENPIGC